MHEYLRRLNKALSLGLIDKGLMTASGLTHVYVGHDQICGAYKGNECDCDPTIIIKTSSGDVCVMKDGSLGGH